MRTSLAEPRDRLKGTGAHPFTPWVTQNVELASRDRKFCGARARRRLMNRKVSQSRLQRTWTSVRFALVLLLSGHLALAGDRLVELATKLKSDKDFRVRTQAALALGVSQSDRAVPPLCDALADANETVRAASAAALGKLRRGGLECINRRLSTEQHPKVKDMLAKALRRLEQPAAPIIGPDTRYYVAIGPTTNKTPGTDGDIEWMVRDALNRELAKEKSLAVAPSDETAAQAEKVLARHKGLKSIYIWPKLQASDEGGALNFKLTFTLFSYPDKALKGSLAQNASMPGARSSDAEALQQLVDAAAPLIVAKFLSNVGRLE